MLLLLDPDREGRSVAPSEVRGKSDLLDRIIAFMESDYDWDDPDYRQICTEIGLDADNGRPAYRNEDLDIVSNLEQWIDSNNAAIGLSPVALDLLGLLRTDRAPEHGAFAECARILADWPFAVDKMPFAAAFDRVGPDRLATA